jgi:8-oxo-dGTP pyrophosphatase MutT (NUDIX family)
VDTPDDEMIELRRTAVRLVLADAAGQILLLHVVEPKYPELGDCWELPGGGIDPDDDVFMAAQRELAEETGLRVPITDIAPPSWFRSVTFLHAGARRVQDEAIAYAAIPGLGPPVQATALSADENEIYLGYR